MPRLRLLRTILFVNVSDADFVTFVIIALLQSTLPEIRSLTFTVIEASPPETSFTVKEPSSVNVSLAYSSRVSPISVAGDVPVFRAKVNSRAVAS